MSRIAVDRVWQEKRWQRFNFNPSGQRYTLTMNARGKVSVFVRGVDKPSKYAPDVARMQWHKITDASEVSDIIADIAAWNGPKLETFMQAQP